MGFSLIMIGLLFMIGPDISIFDLLPDFIGYILILKGISRIAKINSDFLEASKYFKWCLCVSLVKLPFYIMSMAMAKSDEFMMLLCLFVGGLFDAYFAYNAFSSFFNGLSSSTPRNEDISDYKCAVFLNFEKIRKFTLVFAILKPALYIAPELTRIDNSEFGEVTSEGILGLSRFYGIFLFFFSVVALAVGIVWYVVIRKYFKGILDDKVYISFLEEKYNSEFKNDLFKNQSFSILRIFTFWTLAFVFLFKIQLDGINYIPPFLFPVFVYFSTFFMKNAAIDFKKLRIFSLAGLLVSFAYWIYNIVFVNSFIIVDKSDYGMTLSYTEQLDMMLNSDFDTLYGFIGLCAMSFVSSVLGIIMVKYLFDKIFYMAKNHAFDHFGEEYNILTASSDTFENEENESNLKLFNFTKIFCYVIIAFEFIGTALTTIFPAFVQDTIRSLPDSPAIFKIIRSLLTNLTPSLWTIELTLRVIFIICALVLISRIKEGYKNKNYIE